jgi:predicted nucleic acid-binding protein
MIVVADTSPLNYLVLIEQIDVLPKLYGSVVIPIAVREELLVPLAPPPVRHWIESTPNWLEVRDSGVITLSFDPKLDAGEREAITLAHIHRGSLLLIDEALGRQEARHFGIEIIGTLGILRYAHLRGLLDLNEAVKRLQTTTFQASPSLIKSVFASV